MASSRINIDVSGRAILTVLCILSALYVFYLTTAPANNAHQDNNSKRNDVRPVSTQKPVPVNNAHQDTNSKRNDVGRLYSEAELLNLRLNWIYPPGPGYKKVVDKSQVGQAKFVDKLLNRRENGFFIECGARNGLELSNSIFFETRRNWTGLLVEPQPNDFAHLIALRRKAYAINACMSPTKNSGLFAWKIIGGIAGLYESHVFKKGEQQVADKYMQCFSFGAMMAALNVTRVDYFSLDIEGGEVPVLKTINWNDAYIDVIGIEYRCVLLHTFVCFLFCIFFLKSGLSMISLKKYTVCKMLAIL